MERYEPATYLVHGPDGEVYEVFYMKMARRVPRDPTIPMRPANVMSAGELPVRGLYTKRAIGACPRGTPGCKFADCNSAPGFSCYGGNAPAHVDMLHPDEWSY